MKTLYISDLDGTLLNKNAKLTKHTIDVVNRLVSHGMLFTFATARSLESAGGIVAELYLRLPVIVHNGVFIMDMRRGAPIGEPCFFNNRQKACAFELLRQAGVCPLVYTYDRGHFHVMWVEGQENDGVKDYLASRKGDERLCPCKSFEELDRGKIYYFSLIGARGSFDGVQKLFAENTEFNVNLQPDTYNEFEWLEIMHTDASKANAALKLKAMLGADKVVSFGDNNNDLPLFAVSDESYAVANAPDSLKAAATGIIGAAADDGVAAWLRENWL
jgi:Cof subfamily protein (haloacid dehalogenase superfamily)